MWVCLDYNCLLNHQVPLIRKWNCLNFVILDLIKLWKLQERCWGVNYAEVNSWIRTPWDPAYMQVEGVFIFLTQLSQGKHQNIYTHSFSSRDWNAQMYASHLEKVLNVISKRNTGLKSFLISYANIKITQPITTDLNSALKSKKKPYQPSQCGSTVEHWPMNQEVTVLIPSQGACMVWGLNPQ